MEIKTRQIDDKPLTIIIEYPILDAKTKKLINKTFIFAAIIILVVFFWSLK